jgi:hypothetical protein
MNRTQNSRSFFGFPQQQQEVQVIQSTNLDTEKNDLISIMSKYLTKKIDKEETVSRLTTLEGQISTTS